MKMMYSEMSLHPDEFDSFQVGVDSDITFCLRELRVMFIFRGSIYPDIILCVGILDSDCRDCVTEAFNVLRGHISGY